MSKNQFMDLVLVVWRKKHTCFCYYLLYSSSYAVYSAASGLLLPRLSLNTVAAICIWTRVQLMQFRLIASKWNAKHSTQVWGGEAAGARGWGFTYPVCCSCRCSRDTQHKSALKCQRMCVCVRMSVYVCMCVCVCERKFTGSRATFWMRKVGIYLLKCVPDRDLFTCLTFTI